VSVRHTIPLEVRLEGEAVDSETTCMWAGPHVLVLCTTLPDIDLAIEVSSIFVGHEGVPTCSTHLTLGPSDMGPVISTAQHEHANLDPKINSRQCVYEHWQVVLEYLTALGYEATQHVDEDAFAELARVEGMS
jgi:hypothetical protein